MAFPRYPNRGLNFEAFDKMNQEQKKAARDDLKENGTEDEFSSLQRHLIAQLQANATRKQELQTTLDNYHEDIRALTIKRNTIVEETAKKINAELTGQPSPQIKQGPSGCSIL